MKSYRPRTNLRWISYATTRKYNRNSVRNQATFVLVGSAMATILERAVEPHEIVGALRPFGVSQRDVARHPGV
jgi:hypothetical protein